MSLSSFIGGLGSSILGAAYAYRLPIAILSALVVVVVLVVARRRGWFVAARRHPVAASLAVAAVIALGAPVAWYLVSPVFLSTELDEPAPIVAAGDPSGPPAQPAAATPRPAVSPTASVPPASPDGPSPSPTPAPQAPSPTPPAPALAAARSGSFSGTDDFHFGRGTVTLLETAPGEFTLRFEDFAVRNGPDLYVYLSPKRNGYADDAIEVARLKADKGSFNQRIPRGADLSDVRSVLIWCKQFSHLFAVAPLGG
jgi:Electron transfer DM13